MDSIYNLLENSSWERVWEAIIKLYPSQIFNKGGYKKAFMELSGITPKPQNGILEIREGYQSGGTMVPRFTSKKDSKYKMTYLDSPEEESPDNDVYIIDESIPHSPHFSLLYMEWSQILGIKIGENSTSRYGAAGILAHVLFEITFNGFSSLANDKARMLLARESKK